MFCSNELKWIKIFNSFQSIFVCWEGIFLLFYYLRLSKHAMLYVTYML